MQFTFNMISPQNVLLNSPLSLGPVVTTVPTINGQNYMDETDILVRVQMLMDHLCLRGCGINYPGTWPSGWSL